MSIDGMGKDSIGELIVKYKRQIAVGCILVCLVIAVAVHFTGKNQEENVETQAPVVNAEGDGEPEGAAIATTVAKEEDLLAESNPLEKDAYPEVNAIVQQYYDGMASGDMDSLSGILDEISDEEVKKILRSRDVVEGYQNISCYTKRGLEEGSYVVWVYYELKFAQIETPAPGLSPLYVYTNEEGNLIIYNRAEASEELNAYVEELAAGEDIVALRMEVKEKYEAAKAADADLMKREERYAKAGEDTSEPAPEETPEEQPEQPEEAESEPEPEEETPAEPSGETQNRETRFAETVRLRAQPSTESENLGTAYQGEQVTQIESYGDGWSKINYNGKECYCMTEFLE